MSILQKLKSITAENLNSLSEILFPKNFTCEGCGKEIAENDGIILCEDCTDKLTFIGEHRCKKCGAQIKDLSNYCMRCSMGGMVFDRAVSVLTYGGLAKKLLLRFKDSGAKYLGETFAKWMAKELNDSGISFDLITFVPITKAKERKRGYNQSKVLAEELSKICKKTVTEGLLKIKDTGAQKQLTGKERQENLKGSFQVTDKKIFKGKSILLLDDVLTTGATANACAEALHKAGAEKVFVATLCNTECHLSYM